MIGGLVDRIRYTDQEFFNDFDNLDFDFDFDFEDDTSGAVFNDGDDEENSDFDGVATEVVGAFRRGLGQGLML